MSVHFYVQRNYDFNKPNATITFELERLNEGRAMDLGSGIFTVPVQGIYHFEFTCVFHRPEDSGAIYFQVNGDNFGTVSHAVDIKPVNDRNRRYIMTFTASLRLKVNDKVNLYNDNAGVIVDSIYHHSHFTGWLVEDDFI